MTGWPAKRSWAHVGTDRIEGGHRVLLDGQPVETPGGRPVVAPTRALADAMAAEWAAQRETIEPLTMPVMRAVNTAIDRVSTCHGGVARMLGDYAETDLLCHRAAAPPDLADRQARAWDPMLAWAAEALGARLAPTEGVLPVPQDAGAVARLRRVVAGTPAFELTALHDLVTLSGSLILGLAVARGRLTPEAAFDMSRIDEDHQAELWGRDAEAEAATVARRDQFLHAHRFLGLCAAG